MATENVGISTDTSLSLTSVMEGSKNTIPIDNLTPDHPTHGKLFPMWVASKFKDHKLEKFKKSDEDPLSIGFVCPKNTKDSKLGFIIIVGIGLGYIFLILPGQIEKDIQNIKTAIE